MSLLAVKGLIGIFFAIGFCKSGFDLNCLTEEDFHEEYAEYFSQAIIDESGYGGEPSFYIIAKKTGAFYDTKAGSSIKFITARDHFMQIHEFQKDDEDSRERFRIIYGMEKKPCATTSIEEDDKFAKDFIGTDCLTSVNSCIKIENSLYLIGDVFDGDMSSKEMLGWFRGLNSIQKLEVMRNFANKVELLHEKGLFENQIDPRFLYIKNKNAKSVFVRLKVFKDEQISYPKKNNDHHDSSPLEKFLMDKYIVSEKNDIYTLALSFVFMLSERKNFLETIEDFCSGPKANDPCHHRLIPEITKILAEENLKSLIPVISKAMASDLEENYNSMKEFRKAIDEIIEKGIDQVDKLRLLI